MEEVRDFEGFTPDEYAVKLKLLRSKLKTYTEPICKTKPSNTSVEIRKKKKGRKLIAQELSLSPQLSKSQPHRTDLLKFWQLREQYVSDTPHTVLDHVLWFEKAMASFSDGDKNMDLTYQLYVKLVNLESRVNATMFISDSNEFTNQRLWEQLVHQATSKVRKCWMERTLNSSPLFCLVAHRKVWERTGLKFQGGRKPTSAYPSIHWLGILEQRKVWAGLGPPKQVRELRKECIKAILLKHGLLTAEDMVKIICCSFHIPQCAELTQLVYQTLSSCKIFQKSHDQEEDIANSKELMDLSPRPSIAKRIPKPSQHYKRAVRTAAMYKELMQGENISDLDLQTDSDGFADESEIHEIAWTPALESEMLDEAKSQSWGMLQQSEEQAFDYYHQSQIKSEPYLLHEKESLDPKWNEENFSWRSSRIKPQERLTGTHKMLPSTYLESVAREAVPSFETKASEVSQFVDTEEIQESGSLCNEESHESISFLRSDSSCEDESLPDVGKGTDSDMSEKNKCNIESPSKNLHNTFASPFLKSSKQFEDCEDYRCPLFAKTSYSISITDKIYHHSFPNKVIFVSPTTLASTKARDFLADSQDLLGTHPVNSSVSREPKCVTDKEDSKMHSSMYLNMSVRETNPKTNSFENSNASENDNINHVEFQNNAGKVPSTLEDSLAKEHISSTKPRSCTTLSVDSFGSNLQHRSSAVKDAGNCISLPTISLTPETKQSESYQRNVFSGHQEVTGGSEIEKTSKISTTSRNVTKMLRNFRSDKYLQPCELQSCGSLGESSEEKSLPLIVQNISKERSCVTIDLHKQQQTKENARDAQHGIIPRDYQRDEETKLTDLSTCSTLPKVSVGNPGTENSSTLLSDASGKHAESNLVKKKNYSKMWRQNTSYLEYEHSYSINMNKLSKQNKITQASKSNVFLCQLRAPNVISGSEVPSRMQDNVPSKVSVNTSLKQHKSSSLSVIHSSASTITKHLIAAEINEGAKIHKVSLDHSSAKMSVDFVFRENESNTSCITQASGTPCMAQHVKTLEVTEKSAPNRIHNNLTTVTPVDTLGALQVGRNSETPNLIQGDSKSIASMDQSVEYSEPNKYCITQAAETPFTMEHLKAPQVNSKTPNVIKNHLKSTISMDASVEHNEPLKYCITQAAESSYMEEHLKTTQVDDSVVPNVIQKHWKSTTSMDSHIEQNEPSKNGIIVDAETPHTVERLKTAEVDNHSEVASVIEDHSTSTASVEQSKPDNPNITKALETACTIEHLRTSDSNSLEAATMIQDHLTSTTCWLASSSSSTQQQISESIVNSNPLKRQRWKSFKLRDYLEEDIKPKIRKISRKKSSLPHHGQSLEKHKEPLLKGWVREIVSRTTVSCSSNNKDVYYHSPDGKKLRSCVEIAKYLEENEIKDLALDSFTFFRSGLGFGEPYEIVRMAAPKRFYISPGSPGHSPVMPLQRMSRRPFMAGTRNSQIPRVKGEDCLVIDKTLPSDRFWVTGFDDLHNSMETDCIEIVNENGELTGYEEWAPDGILKEEQDTTITNAENPTSSSESLTTSTTASITSTNDTTTTTNTITTVLTRIDTVNSTASLPSTFTTPSMIVTSAKSTGTITSSTTADSSSVSPSVSPLLKPTPACMTTTSTITTPTASIITTLASVTPQPLNINTTSDITAKPASFISTSAEITSPSPSITSLSTSINSTPMNATLTPSSISTETDSNLISVSNHIPKNYSTNTNIATSPSGITFTISGTSPLNTISSHSHSFTSVVHHATHNATARQTKQFQPRILNVYEPAEAQRLFNMLDSPPDSGKPNSSIQKANSRTSTLPSHPSDSMQSRASIATSSITQTLIPPGNHEESNAVDKQDFTYIIPNSAVSKDQPKKVRVRSSWHPRVASGFPTNRHWHHPQQQQLSNKDSPQSSSVSSNMRQSVAQDTWFRQQPSSSISINRQQLNTVLENSKNLQSTLVLGSNDNQQSTQVFDSSSNQQSIPVLDNGQHPSPVMRSTQPSTSIMDHRQQQTSSVMRNTQPSTSVMDPRHQQTSSVIRTIHLPTKVIHHRQEQTSSVIRGTQPTTSVMDHREQQTSVMRNTQTSTSVIDHRQQHTSVMRSTQPSTLVMDHRQEQTSSVIRGTQPITSVIDHREQQTSVMRNTQPSTSVMEHRQEQTSSVMRNTQSSTSVMDHWQEQTSSVIRNTQPSTLVMVHKQQQTCSVIGNRQQQTLVTKNRQHLPPAISNTQQPSKDIIWQQSGAIMDNRQQPTMIRGNKQQPTLFTDHRQQYTQVMGNRQQPTVIVSNRRRPTPSMSNRQQSYPLTKSRQQSPAFVTGNRQYQYPHSRIREQPPSVTDKWQQSVPGSMKQVTYDFVNAEQSSSVKNNKQQTTPTVYNRHQSTPAFTMKPESTLVTNCFHQSTPVMSYKQQSAPVISTAINMNKSQSSSKSSHFLIPVMSHNQLATPVTSISQVMSDEWSLPPTSNMQEAIPLSVSISAAGKCLESSHHAVMNMNNVHQTPSTTDKIHAAIPESSNVSQTLPSQSKLYKSIPYEGNFQHVNVVKRGQQAIPSVSSAPVTSSNHAGLGSNLPTVNASNHTPVDIKKSKQTARKSTKSSSLKAKSSAHVKLFVDDGILLLEPDSTLVADDNSASKTDVDILVSEPSTITVKNVPVSLESCVTESIKTFLQLQANKSKPDTPQQFSSPSSQPHGHSHMNVNPKSKIQENCDQQTINGMTNQFPVLENDQMTNNTLGKPAFIRPPPPLRLIPPQITRKVNKITCPPLIPIRQILSRFPIQKNLTHSFLPITSSQTTLTTQNTSSVFQSLYPLVPGTESWCQTSNVFKDNVNLLPSVPATVPSAALQNQTSPNTSQNSFSVHPSMYVPQPSIASLSHTSSSCS